MNFNDLYALKVRTQDRLSMVLAQKPDIWAAKERGEDVRELWESYHEARQLLEANLAAVTTLAFQGRRKQPTNHNLPKGKNRRGDAPWMQPFWEIVWALLAIYIAAMIVEDFITEMGWVVDGTIGVHH